MNRIFSGMKPVLKMFSARAGVILGFAALLLLACPAETRADTNTNEVCEVCQQYPCVCCPVCKDYPCKCCPVCNTYPCECGDDDDDGDGSTKDPIDTSSGDNYFTQAGLYVPCPGIPLQLNLKYQSVTTRNPGMFGTNWVHSYEWAVDVESDEAEMHTGGGSVYHFELQDDGTYEVPESNNWKLEAVDGGYEAELPGGRYYDFNADGTLLSIRDAWGNQVSCTYGTNDCLESVSHSNGRRLVFSNVWNEASAVWKIASIAVDGGASLSFAYGSDGQFTQVVEQVGNETFVSEYKYADGYLTNRVNGAGQVYSFSYESDGGKLNGKGTHLDVDGYYDHDLNYVSDDITDVTYHRRGEEQEFRYSRTDGELRYVYGPGGDTADAVQRGTRYEYNDNGDKTEETLFDDSIDETYTQWMLYDDEHNMTNLSIAYCSEDAVQLSAMEYDTAWSLPTAVEEADGSRTEIVYTNGSPAVLKQFYSDTESYDTAFTYTANGLLKALTNANLHVVNFQYDLMGNRTAVIPQAGPSVTNTYNSLGHLKRSEILSESGSSTGRKAEFETDAKGRVKTVTFADGLENTYAYNALGYLTNAVDRAGRTTAYTYLPSRRLSSVTRWLNQSGSNIPVRVGFDLDQQLNVLRISEPRGRYVESYKLDIQDRVTAVTNIEGQVMNIDYGLGSFVKQFERFDGSSVSNTYDSAGRTQRVTYNPGSADPVSIDCTYWPDSRLKSVSDDLSAVTYSFDLLNRLTNSTSSVSSVLSAVNHQYDGVNLTNTVVSIGGAQTATATYTFDTAERLKSITTENTEQFVYTYNPDNGRVASISNSVSGLVCSYDYDLLDRVTNITYQAGTNLVRSLDYEYNAVSMIKKKKIVDGASSFVEHAYTYDSLDRLVGEICSGSVSSDYSVVYNYDLAGNRLSKTAEGLRTTYTIGSGNRLASSTTSACTNSMFVSGTSSETIGTDNQWGTLYISNLTANTGVVPDVNGSSFSAEVPVLGSTTNTLVAAIRDEAGNMGYATNDIFVGTTEYTEDTEKSYAYDSAGCLTNLNGTSLEWDERYRLTKVDGASSSVEYAYDVLGRRTTRIANGSTNYFVYNGNQVVADLDGSGNLLRTYVWGTGIDNLLCMTVYESDEGVASTNTYYAVKDHQNTVLALADESGSVVESYEYTAYGETTVFDASGTELAESALGNRYTFQGREIDWTTGLIYFRARWYDPSSGRWISKDPIGISGGLNLYEFCGSNPVNYIDPLGLDNLNFALPGSREAMVIDARGTTVGEFSVGGHGVSGGGVLDQRSGQNAFPSPSQLANEIRNNPAYSPGMTVRLNACQAGKGDYAQNLANELQCTVIAPLSNLYTGVWPPAAFGDPNSVLFDWAKWEEFDPN